MEKKYIRDAQAKVAGSPIQKCPPELHFFFSFYNLYTKP